MHSPVRPDRRGAEHRQQESEHHLVFGSIGGGRCRSGDQITDLGRCRRRIERLRLGSARARRGPRRPWRRRAATGRARRRTRGRGSDLLYDRRRGCCRRRAHRGSARRLRHVLPRYRSRRSPLRAVGGSAGRPDRDHDPGRRPTGRTRADADARGRHRRVRSSRGRLRGGSAALGDRSPHRLRRCSSRRRGADRRAELSLTGLLRRPYGVLRLGADDNGARLRHGGVVAGAVHAYRDDGVDRPRPGRGRRSCRCLSAPLACALACGCPPAA